MIALAIKSMKCLFLPNRAAISSAFLAVADYRIEPVRWKREQIVRHRELVTVGKPPQMQLDERVANAIVPKAQLLPMLTVVTPATLSGALPCVVTGSGSLSAPLPHEYTPSRPRDGSVMPGDLRKKRCAGPRGSSPLSA